MPFDTNTPLGDRTDFPLGQEALRDGEYKVRIIETLFETQGDREERRAANISAGRKVGDNNPVGPMGTITYQVLTGEDSGATHRDYIWLHSKKGPDEQQGLRLQTILRMTGVLASDKRLTFTQAEAGLKKAMKGLQGKQLGIITMKDRSERAVTVGYRSNSQGAVTTDTEEDVPF